MEGLSVERGQVEGAAWIGGVVDGHLDETLGGQLNFKAQLAFELWVQLTPTTIRFKSRYTTYSAFASSAT